MKVQISEKVIININKTEDLRLEWIKEKNKAQVNDNNNNDNNDNSDSKKINIRRAQHTGWCWVTLKIIQ